MPKPEERPAARPHDLILESRTTLTVTGVQKVLHCSPESAALVHGAGGLCRSPLHGSRAGHSGAVGRAVSGVGAGCSGAPCPAMGAAAAGAAARSAPRSTQRTPERKKNRKKSEKELAKPAPCVV